MRRSIRLKLVMLLGVVAALAVLVPGAFTAHREVEEAREQALREKALIGELVATQVRYQVTQLQQELGMLAHDPTFVDNVLAGDLELITRRLESAARQDPDLVSLGFFDAGGTLRAISLPDKASIGLDASRARPVQDVLRTERPAVGTRGLGSPRVAHSSP